MAKSLTANVPSEPFPHFYENCFKLLLAYPQVKLKTTDNMLMGSEKRDYITWFFPKWKQIHVTLDKDNTKKRKEQLKNYPHESKECFFMTRIKRTDLLSFIHHLRNAIAHGEITAKNNYIEIKDYFYNKYENKLYKTPSAMCRISCENLQKFMSEIIKVL